MILAPRNPLRLDAAGLFVGAQRNSQTEGVSLSASGCCEWGATERGHQWRFPSLVLIMPRAFTHRSAVAGNEGGAWRCADPKWEARCLVQLLGKNGHTIDKVRELIRVTPKEEAILRTSALHSPTLDEHIERVLRYRVQVAEEFERLVTRYRY